MLGTLEAKKYVVYNEQTRTYRLAFSALTLGKAFERSNPLVSLSRAFLKEIAQSTGESALLYVIDSFDRVCLAREKGTHNLRYSIYEGQRLPLYPSASGKVLLAFGPEELRKKFLKDGLRKKLTDRTIVDPEAFEAELSKVRSKGYAFSEGERLEDVAALAAPIFNDSKIMCAALAIAGPIRRFLENYESRYLPVLLSCSRNLSIALGMDSLVVTKPSTSGGGPG